MRELEEFDLENKRLKQRIKALESLMLVAQVPKAKRERYHDGYFPFDLLPTPIAELGRMYIHSETTIVLTGRSYERLLTLMRQALATPSALRFHAHSTLPDGAIDITDGHGEPVQFSLDIARVGSPRRAPYRYRTRRA